MGDTATNNTPWLFRLYVYVAGSFLAGLFIAVEMEPGLLGLQFQFDVWPFALLTAFGVLTRFLRIQALGQITVILDTPVYLTAIFTLGTLQGGLVVFTSMSIYFVWRIGLRVVRPAIERRPMLDLLGVALYSSGMTSMVMVALATMFGVDDNLSTFRRAPGYGLIPVLGFCFLVGQYTLAIVPYMLKGVDFGRIVKKVILPGLLMEVILLQLAVLAVITYERTDLTPFLLLATTYLFVNYVVHRLSQISGAQSRQLEELEALNRLGQTICTTLDSAQLMERIAEESLEVFESADAFMLSYSTGGKEDSIQSMVQGRGGQSPPAEFLTDDALVMAEEAHLMGHPILRNNKQGSWMVAPITVNDEKMGKLALWSAVGFSFDARDLQFLGTLAHQATFGMENARLYELSTIDSLTGLYLRRYFETRLSEEFARVDRYKGNCSVVMIDVDWLKTINDNLGHAVGDAALTHVAQVMKEETRLLDVPARLGGDEFAILLPNEEIEMARLVAERIRTRIAANPVVTDLEQVKVTVSMGIASYPTHSADSPAALVALADRALYQSKLAPERNQAVVFQPTDS